MYNSKIFVIVFLAYMPIASLSMEPPPEHHRDSRTMGHTPRLSLLPNDNFHETFLQRPVLLPALYCASLQRICRDDNVGDEGSDEESNSENVLDPGGSLSSLLSSLSTMQIHTIRLEQPNVPSINNNLPTAAISDGPINANEKVKATKRTKLLDPKRVQKRQRIPTVDQPDVTIPMPPNE